ncbi:Pinin [Amphibalanus amphitrite]|uniref:Pinin n=1 Tax=Amphibalanus amphitrite TaxID=1232801 RepID=A0A6A4VFP0_AMPAM|nr:Pinin [Amphibalanus amphitrite]
MIPITSFFSTVTSGSPRRPVRRRISGPGGRPADDFGGRHVEIRGDFGRPYPDGRGDFAGRGRPPYGTARAEFGGDRRPEPDGRGFYDARGRRRERHDAEPRDEDGGPAAKRRITHGSNGRLGVVVIGPRLRRASASDEEPEPKPSVASHVIPGPGSRAADLEPPDDGRSRQTALQERKGDKENINRSRRMFGALLGTLQRFRTDEVKQKEKDHLVFLMRRGRAPLVEVWTTWGRLLHFGEHCKNLRRKVKPRTAQLRKLTGRSWGLQEAQLRTVANGYVRGALEYAAAAWLPAVSEAHVELIERELRAAARAVTGCTASTPTAPLMAEAGIPPARVRCPALAARMVGLAASLPGDDPLHAVGEMHVAPRLRTTTGWRDVGHRQGCA